ASMGAEAAWRRRDVFPIREAARLSRYAKLDNHSRSRRTIAYFQARRPCHFPRERRWKTDAYVYRFSIYRFDGPRSAIRDFRADAKRPVGGMDEQHAAPTGARGGQ